MSQIEGRVKAAKVIVQIFDRYDLVVDGGSDDCNERFTGIAQLRVGEKEAFVGFLRSQRQCAPRGGGELSIPLCFRRRSFCGDAVVRPNSE